MIQSRKKGSKIYGKFNLTRGLSRIKADWDDAITGLNPVGAFA